MGRKRSGEEVQLLVLSRSPFQQRGGKNGSGRNLVPIKTSDHSRGGPGGGRVDINEIDILFHFRDDEKR